jgi:uncharacterized protein with von Willebrand factor type A (vWA) domain
MSGPAAHIVGFGRALRAAGVEVGATQLQDAVGALAGVDLGVREEVYWALRCTLCSRYEHIEIFDALFEEFLRSGVAEPVDAVPEPEPAPTDGEPEGDDAGTTRALEPAPVSDMSEAAEGEHGHGASTTERLLDLDFRAYGPEELRAARKVIERIARALPLRQSRRMEAAAAGRRIDMRRTLRMAMRTEGHPIERGFRRREMTPRRTVFLLDISGSMAPYTRPVITFAQAAVSTGRSVEAFTFGTRVTRLTRHLAGADPDRAISRAADAVPDWAGGTRIGASLKAFNDGWGRRGLARGALVIVVSDGWERGDPSLLRSQMAILHRAAHTVAWVNPLAGDPRYRPVARGMAAALPSVDVFLSGHSLRALADLVGALETLGGRHGATRRPAGVAA